MSLVGALAVGIGVGVGESLASSDNDSDSNTWCGKRVCSHETGAYAAAGTVAR